MTIALLSVVNGYFGVFWRFIPDWPQALAILAPLAAGLILLVRSLSRIEKNRLGISTEKWLVRCGAVLLFWSILMTTSYAGGPKLRGYVYPMGISINGFGLAAGVFIIIRSPLWTLKRGVCVKTKLLNTIRSRGAILGIIMITWLLASAILSEPERFQATNIGFEHDAPTRFAPYYVERSMNPLIGGYMTTEYKEGAHHLARAKAVKLTVSFNGTEDSFPETIQPDNYLGIGMAISGPDYMWGSTLSIDWGYSFILFLNSSGGPYIQIEIWKAYESFNFAEKVVSIAYSNPEYLQLNSSVTLRMEWNDLGYLNYYITIEDKPDLPSPIYQYCPDVRDSSSPYFYLTPPRAQAFVRYFQFIGAWSAYSISSAAWMTNIFSPEFVYTRGSYWESVDYAYSISGVDALLDCNIRWGGTSYEDVYIKCHGTHPQIPPSEMRFHSVRESGHFKERTLLWDPDVKTQLGQSNQSTLRMGWVPAYGPFISVLMSVFILFFIAGGFNKIRFYIRTRIKTYTRARA